MCGVSFISLNIFHLKIVELIGDLLLKKPTESAYEERCLIIFGIPVVASERLMKLQTVLGKLFKKISEDYKDHFPVDENGTTKVRFSSCAPDKFRKKKQAGW